MPTVFNSQNHFLEIPLVIPKRYQAPIVKYVHKQIELHHVTQQSYLESAENNLF